MQEKHRQSAGKLKNISIQLLPALIALLIRLWFIMEMRHHPFSTFTPQVVDAWTYHRWALEIIQDNFWGKEVFFLRPIYPYLLALIYTIFGPNIIAVQIFQAFLASISCYLLFQIAKRLFNQQVALIASIGFGLCGTLVFYTGTLLYVEITTFLSLLVLYLLLTAGEKWWKYSLAGLGYGLFVVCRPEMLVLLLPLIFWLRKIRETKPRQLLNFLIISLMVILSVPVRNYIIARDPVLFTAHSGINFYFGNNPNADGTWQPVSELNPGIGFSHLRLKHLAKFVNGKQLSWSQASFYWTKKGIEFIFSHPVQYLKLTGRKLALFFASYEIPNNYYPETVRPSSRALKIAFVNFGMVISLALLGIIFSWKTKRQLLPVYLFIGGYLLSSLLFYVLSRLRAPVLPFLLIIASSSIFSFYQFFRQRKFALLLLGVIVTTLIYWGTKLIPVNHRIYSAQAWTQLGNVYLEQKKPEQAIFSLNTALHYNPADYSARYSLIQLYAGMRRIAEAQKEFQQLQAIADNTPAAQLILHLSAARIAIAERHFTTALQHYKAALILDPYNPETYYLMGLVFISIGNLVEAQKCLSFTLELDQNHDAARSALLYIQHFQ
jgi:tetratricopeptide (TPR) repeat protein